MEIVHVRTMFWDVIGNRLHRMLCYRPSKKRTLCYHGYDLLECWYLEEYPICRAFTSGYKTYSGTPRGEVPASPPGDTGKTLALPPTAPPPSSTSLLPEGQPSGIYTGSNDSGGEVPTPWRLMDLARETRSIGRAAASGPGWAAAGCSGFGSSLLRWIRWWRPCGSGGGSFGNFVGGGGGGSSGATWAGHRRLSACPYG